MYRKKKEYVHGYYIQDEFLHDDLTQRCLKEFSLVRWLREVFQIPEFFMHIRFTQSGRVCTNDCGEVKLEKKSRG